MCLALLLCGFLLAVHGEPFFPWWSSRHWRSRLGLPCPLRPDPVSSVRSALTAALSGQSAVVHNVSDSVQSWLDDQSSGHYSPLVLILVGSTGVGKTEAAYAVARGLLAREVSTPEGGGSRVPLGLVEFRGEHFMEGNVTAQREELRQGVARALYECAGRAVLVFDEIQKANKPALSELVALMQGSNSRVAGMDASRLVVILTSDSGVCFLDEFGSPCSSSGCSARAREIARERFNERLRRRLNEDFEEADVPLGSLANHIIPFQPVTWDMARSVLAHHLQHSRLPKALQELMDDLTLEPSALSILASMAYVPYSSFKCGARGAEREETSVCKGFKASRGEARELAEPAAAAEQSLGADGTQSSSSSSSSGQAPDPSQVCGYQCSEHDSCTAYGGSRAVMWTSESPVKRLVRLLHRGPVGQWLSQQPSPEKLRQRAAAQGSSRSTTRGLPPVVEVRVQAACNLQGVRVANLCTRQGAEGVGLRVLYCVVEWGQGDDCQTVWEGALP
jgi:DNA polymerase III delta prime subunit